MVETLPDDPDTTDQARCSFDAKRVSVCAESATEAEVQVQMQAQTMAKELLEVFSNLLQLNVRMGQVKVCRLKVFRVSSQD